MCDMQKVPNTVATASLGSNLHLPVANTHLYKVMLMQGEILQSPVVPDEVQAVACAHTQSGIDRNAVFVGTSNGMLHLFRTSACC